MADLSKPRVVAVGGPTASGKTALSVALARAFDGEIINADSMQIYKNLDVGTAKPSAEERQGIPHYLLDFLSPDPYECNHWICRIGRETFKGANYIRGLL